MAPFKKTMKRILLGSDPRLARMLGYWAAVAALYIACALLLMVQVSIGTADRGGATWLLAIGLTGIAVSGVVVRASSVLRLRPSQLAIPQSVFAIACNIAAYAVTGPLRGGWLMFLLVVMVFCAFSLRPKHAMMLCAAALAMLGWTMAGLVADAPALYPVHVEAMHFAFAACALISVTLLTGEMSKLRTRMKRQKEDLESAMATIRKLATLDELTSLANRRHMNEVLVEEERRQDAAGKPTCVALIDLDHFKSVNDRFGHAAGDTVLRAFSNSARSELRSHDVLARWGGEEFLLLLPEASLEQATMVVRRMAERVGAVPLAAIDRDLRITFSAGVTQRRHGEPFAETITRADQALYDAKAKGRNRIAEA
ncbi:MAG TPA: diguanylate cyclase [Telluria sp.]